MDKKLQARVDTLKARPNHTRADIAELLASIAPPGKKLKTKQNAVAALEKTNTQGIDILETLTSYGEY